MGLIYSETSSGLVAAHTAAGEAQVRRALKDHDPDLRLVPRMIGDRLGWAVLKHLGSAVDAQWICDWDDNGEPLPLSHGLVQRVKDMDLNSRAPIIDPEALNDQMVEEARAEFGDAADSAAADIVERLRERTLYCLPRRRRGW